MKKILSTLALLTLLTTCAYAHTQNKNKNLLCLSANPEHALLVYVDTTHKQLVINGEVHNYAKVLEYSGSSALHTENFENIEGKLSYITLTSIDHGKHAGMYLALYDLHYAVPTALIPMRCQHYNWKE